MWEVDRDTVFDEFFMNCMQEMYKWSQPSLDFKKYCNELKETNKIDKSLYEHHYLSHKNFLIIKEHYLDIYNLKPYWREYCEVIKNYLFKGGRKDIYIKPKDGSPGYRSSEKTLPVSSFLNEEDTNKLYELLDNCANFYRLDKRHNDAEFSICLGCSPTSNKQSVIDYWKSKGKDINIEDFDVEDKIYGTDNDEEE